MDVFAAFSPVVGRQHVLVDDDVRAGYETDWTGRYTGRSVAVVRPGTTDEVAAVLRRCTETGTTVVPQGGNSGLVGGSVPRAHDGTAIVLSTRRLDHLGPVDRVAQQVTVGAGVTLARWREHARAAGLDTPIDFAARAVATVGGAIATNAGGSRVVRYGTMRSQLTGIEAVLADGTVVGSLAGLPKETAGLHWPSLLAGSEGTLAVVTHARVRLVPHFAHVVTAMVSVGSVDDAVRLLGRLRSALTSLDSIELVLPDAMRVVAAHLGHAPPVAAERPALLVECADRRDPTDELAGVIAAAPEMLDVAVATDAGRRDGLLAFRDRITEAIAAVAAGTAVFKLDVAVPVDELEAVLEVARRAAQADGAELVAFGHLAEGNLHLNFLGAVDTVGIADRVLPEVAARRGTISAEHGIGVAKTAWLPLVRSAGDLRAQRAIARALDPAGIMNPGVLAPAGTERPAGQEPGSNPRSDALRSGR